MYSPERGKKPSGDESKSLQCKEPTKNSQNAVLSLFALIFGGIFGFYLAFKNNALHSVGNLIISEIISFVWIDC
jgi:hypothetical protein